MPKARLFSLFFACFASIGYEIALARFFSLSSWSEYGYWVISIAMVGLAASGTVAALVSGWLVRRSRLILVLLPILMMVAATVGWHVTTIVPFNPLELQNRQLWGAQLGNIAAYYAALFPFFFLVGFYVSLIFVVHSRQVSRVYAADLGGAGLGAVAVLALMFVVPPLQLVACLLPALALAALLEVWGHPERRRLGLLALVVFLPCQASLVLMNQSRMNEFKDIFAPLNTRDGRVLAEIRSPKGLYQLVDSFVERLDSDLSNNAGRLGVRGLPRAFGLYLLDPLANKLLFDRLVVHLLHQGSNLIVRSFCNALQHFIGVAISSLDALKIQNREATMRMELRGKTNINNGIHRRGQHRNIEGIFAQFEGYIHLVWVNRDITRDQRDIVKSICVPQRFVFML